MEGEQGLSVRVLFAGACRGNFNKLLKRVEKVHNRNGPFDALFCVGHFFAENETTEKASGVVADDEDDHDDAFVQFLNSSQKMPMQTYILGAYGRGSDVAIQKMEEMNSSNVHYLGRSGIFEMPNGLTVAFLEGIYDADHFDQEPLDRRYYTRQDIASLKKSVQSHGGDVDFFLSCEWPSGVTNNLARGSVEDLGDLPEGSPHIASLLTIVRPRYHVTSQPSLFFNRAPYINPDLGAGPHVTRFTSLCPFGTVTKQNLFALCLTPAQFMESETLCEIPSDATHCPFHVPSDGKRTTDAEVRREAVAVDDSSCTPHPYGRMPSIPQQHLQQPLWNQQQLTMPFQQQQQQPPYVMLGFPESVQATHAANGNLGDGVQTLLQNIGRGGSYAGVGARMEPASVQHPSTLGGNNFGFSNPFSPQTAFPMSNASISQTHLSGLSMPSNLQAYPMHLAAPNQPAFAPPPPAHPPTGDMQNLWMHITQNPQLLNAAISMGLIQNPQPVAPPIVASNPQHMLLANALSKMTAPEQQSYPLPKGLAQMEIEPSIQADSIVSDRQAPIPMETDRSPFPTPQSKRYKKGGQNKAVHVKDRRKTCFVGRIHPDATRQELGQFFSQAGEVVHVVLNPSDKGNLSWAFVQFATQEERNRASQMLDRAFFGGHELIVKPAKLELEFDPNEPVKECWFCLGSPASDKALIVSIGQDAYVAMDKGSITDDHMLVIPTNHYPSTLRMPAACYEEMQIYLKGLRDLFVSQGRYMLAFERYILIPRLHGNHAHISVISIDEDAARRAKETFVQRGRMQSGEWSFLSVEEGSRENVHDLVGDEEYLLVILPDGSKLVRPMFKKDRLPISFARDVMAELAGSPERADWKVCLCSESEEKTKVERFKTQFKTFDYPNQG